MSKNQDNTAMHEQRKQALAARRNMHPDLRRKSSDKICKTIVTSRAFHAAKNIACYLPMNDEVDVRPVIERGWRANKRIFVPITRAKRKMFFREIRPETTLVRNAMSIWEPAGGPFIDPRELQLTITPTVVFDKHRHRIGMGGGYYDRCFSFLRHRIEWLTPKLVGVAFDCQEVEEISANPWDIRLYRVISESNSAQF